jgi:transposase
MPRYLVARAPLDATEARHIRKLAQSQHAPADGIFHAKMVVGSWDGHHAEQIAMALPCHPQTVRDRLHSFTTAGLDGLGMQPGSGRPPRLTQEERSRILGLAKQPPPGKATYVGSATLTAPEPEGEPEWTLDALTAAAQQQGIRVARSQVRRIFQQEGVRWRRTRQWATSHDPDFVPKGPRSSRSLRSHRPRPRSFASTHSAR